MARRISRDPFALVLVLLLLVAISTYMTFKYSEAYRTVDCQGITCDEGQFCQQNKCRSITA
jgi:hypothetical protein